MSQLLSKNEGDSAVMEDPKNHVLPYSFAKRNGVVLVQNSENEVIVHYKKGLNDVADSLPEPEDLLESEDDAPIIRLINAILTQAVKENASDIHIETFENRMIVRMRVDGVLREILEPPRSLAALVISRIKVMAKLDIAEKRIPQDGRISLRVAGRGVDVRVSTEQSYDKIQMW